jgi:hypothetical protein
MKLAIDIPDMNTPRFSAVQSLTVRPVAGPVSTLTLDAHLLDIQSVACAGHQVTFKSDGTPSRHDVRAPALPRVGRGDRHDLQRQ